MKPSRIQLHHPIWLKLFLTLALLVGGLLMATPARAQITITSMGGTVWDDVDGGGTQAVTGEPGIPDVTVALHDTAGNPVTCMRAGGPNLTQTGTVTATHVATYNGNESSFAADHAVDDNIDSASISTNVAEAWWQVDLGASSTIREVHVYPNHFNYGFHHQTEDIYVFVSATDPTGQTLAQLLANPNVWHSDLYGAWTGVPLVVPAPAVNGRYVRVQHSDTNYLRLSEVKVYGDGSEGPVTTVTDANGNYSFSDTADCITAGATYSATIDLQKVALADRELTGYQVGIDPTVDSDALPATYGGVEYGEIAMTAPAAGTTDNSYDAGFKPAPTTVTIEKIEATGCYQNNGSKATVSVQVGWISGADGDTITVTLNPGTLTRTIKPESIYTAGAAGKFAGPIKTPQVVAFEIDANGPDTGDVTVVYQNSGGATLASTGPQNYDIPAPCPPLACTAGQLGGTAFVDYNADGVKDAGEVRGAGGVTVTAYDATGAAASATTDGAGDWVINDSLTYPVRVELTDLPDYGLYTTAQTGADNGGSTLFLDAATCDVDAGIGKPSDFVQENPPVAVPMWVNGDPLAGGDAAEAAVVLSFDYDHDSDIAAIGGGNQANVTVLAEGQQIGTTWGEAWHAGTGRLLVAATLRRHSGLGPAGIGAIYVIDPARGCNGVPFLNGTCSPTTNLGGTVVDTWDLTSLGVNVGEADVPSNAARGLPASKSEANWDESVLGLIGKRGIGDIDMSEDGNKLWFVNLHDKELYSLDISAYNASGAALTNQDVSHTPIPDPGCVGGESRPWATTVEGGKVYVGTVCDASTSQDKSDLTATVFALDPALGTWDTVFDLPLTYPKGYASPRVSILDNRMATGWYPWTDDPNTHFSLHMGINEGNPIHGKNLQYPTPIFMDIEFDIDGAMILGFNDRAAIQWGWQNYWPGGTGTGMYTSYVGGDILRAYYSADTGAYVLENAAKAGPATGAFPTNNQGPGFGEFYEDIFGGHTELAQGGLAVKPGSGQVVAGVMDPVGAFTGGVRYFDNTNGGEHHNYPMYYGQLDAGFHGKSSSLGDVEILAEPLTALQIGNRVWGDADEDGIQDPDEAGIGGITVELYQNGVLVGTTTTIAVDDPATPWNEIGSYAFGGLNDNNMLSGSLLTNTDYEIRIDMTQPALAGLSLTRQNAPQPANGNAPATTNDADQDVADSDATASGSSAVIAYTTGGPGENNHGLDFGFRTEPATIGNYVWLDENSDGQQDAGEPGIPNVTVNLYDDAGNLVATTVTDADGGYLFDGLEPGTYYVDVEDGTVPAGFSQTTVYGTPNTDFGNQDHSSTAIPGAPGGETGYPVTVGPGDENLTADFGYNANPTDDVNNGTGVAALGDRVWIDADQDGIQDPGEMGVAGVTLALFTDSDGDGLYDDPVEDPNSTGNPVCRDHRRQRQLPLR